MAYVCQNCSRVYHESKACPRCNKECLEVPYFNPNFVEMNNDVEGEKNDVVLAKQAKKNMMDKKNKINEVENDNSKV